MTETTNGTVSLKPDLGRFGVWTGGPVTPEEALEIEKLGYGAVWVGASPAADLSFVEPILEKTDTLQVATGIVNIWSAPADEVAESYHRIEKRLSGKVSTRHRGRASRAHAGVREAVRRPGGLPGRARRREGADQPTGHRRAGARVLKLARERSAGAHPYLTTPEHTAQARELVGNTVFLAPEHKVALTRDAAQARELGRETVGFYLDLSNYVNNWRRLGFTADDVAKPGSDKLIDAVVAHGTPETIAARLTEHLDAGADHVAIQVLGAATICCPPWPSWPDRWGCTGRVPSRRS